MTLIIIVLVNKLHVTKIVFKNKNKKKEQKGQNPPQKKKINKK